MRPDYPRTERRRGIVARLQSYVDGSGAEQSAEGGKVTATPQGASASQQDGAKRDAGLTARPADLREPKCPARDRLHQAIGARERSYTEMRKAQDNMRAPAEDVEKRVNDWVAAVDVYCEALLAHERAVAERAVRERFRYLLENGR